MEQNTNLTVKYLYFLTTGRPLVDAVVGCRALDTTALVIWEQQKSPNGTAWYIVEQNVDLTSYYVKKYFLLPSFVESFTD